ncbi:MAG: hypothetical protein JXX28_13245, partial [Deltaproteobacteria bacterium]|nr:hypothetical protein [Deltaproteobacteria bacterium]
MAVNDWVPNLYQSEQTRGLSGGGATGVALDASNPYYNFRLRRHKAEGDVVADPALLWHTSPYVKRRTGLGTHIAATRGEGVATYTDALLILSERDYDRALGGATSAWMSTATRTLLQEFEDFCRRESFERAFGHRQLGFRILRDGSAELGNERLHLGEGEFITGLLPNLYSGPVRGSHPVIGIHLNIPGAWEGYQEVGRLFSDQILFTLGSHWLDNFTHPALKEAALYRLQRYPDGTFVHIINPDLQDRFQVTSTDQGGASVLTLATRAGEPVAYVVLAIIDPPSANSGVVVEEYLDEDGPDVAAPMMIDDAVELVSTDATGAVGSRTIIPDSPQERIFTLQERGALLQKVHFSGFMKGYDVYVGTRGELGTVVDEVGAVFQVRKREISVKALIDRVTVQGRAVAKGTERVLDGNADIQVGDQHLEFRDLRGLQLDGWPYVGEIRQPASSNYLVWGEDHRIGRSRECRVVLPDEPRNDNIHWKESVVDGATIRARTGDIPKSRFYTDSIMVASEHASIDLSGEEPSVVCTARHCYVYVRRGTDLLVLYPTTSGRSPQELALKPSDEVMIGNSTFYIGFSPTQAAAVRSQAPKVDLSPTSFLDAVSDPEITPRHHQAPPDMGDPEDLPPASGLGERGEAPKSVPLEPVGMDSILGVGFDAPPPPPRKARLSPAGMEPPKPSRPAPEFPPPPRRMGNPKTIALFDDDDEMDLPVSAPPPPPKVTEPDEEDWLTAALDAPTDGPSIWDDDAPTQMHMAPPPPTRPLRPIPGRDIPPPPEASGRGGMPVVPPAPSADAPPLSPPPASARGALPPLPPIMAPPPLSPPPAPVREELPPLPPLVAPPPLSPPPAPTRGMTPPLAPPTLSPPPAPTRGMTPPLAPPTLSPPPAPTRDMTPPLAPPTLSPPPAPVR